MILAETVMIRSTYTIMSWSFYSDLKACTQAAKAIYSFCVQLK